MDHQIENLYRAYSHRLRGRAYKILKNRSDAEDAVQNVCERLLTGYDLSDVQKIEYFLMTMVRRASFNIKNNSHMRRSRVSDDVYDAKLADDKQCSPERIVVAKSELALVLDAMDRLSEKERKTLIAHRLAEQSVVEISRLTGRSERTVYNYLTTSVNYCRAILRKGSI